MRWDLSLYLAGFLIGKVVPILPGRASHFHPNETPVFFDYDSLMTHLAHVIQKSGHPVICPDATYSSMKLQIKLDSNGVPFPEGSDLVGIDEHFAHTGQ